MKPHNESIVLHFNLTHDGKIKRKYHEHIATHTFPATFSAKKFIEAVIGEDPHKWTGPNQLTVRNWFTITTDDLSTKNLEDIMEHKYIGEEKTWTLRVPYTQYAKQIAAYHRGTHPDFNTRSGEAVIPDPRKEELRLTPPAAKEHKSKEPEPKAPKAPKKQKDSNLVSLADICKPLKLDPREARQALRKSKTPKPDNGWSWPKSEAPAISKKLPDLVKKHVKKGK